VHVAPKIIRFAMMAVAAAGAVLILLLVLSAVLLAPSGSGRGGQSIDHEPISLELAHQLIGSGQVYLIAIRGRMGNVDEFCYFLFDDDDTSCRWRVDGENVHVFTEGMPTGVPILSDDQDEVGLTSDQFDDLLQRVEQYNATASAPIEVLDQRG